MNSYREYLAIAFTTNMPIKYRIQGPENTYVPTLSSTALQTYLESKARTDKTGSGCQRADGRQFNAARSLFLKRGVNTQANGSVYAECGTTKILVSVYGPRQATHLHQSASYGSGDQRQQLDSVVADSSTSDAITDNQRNVGTLSGSINCDFKYTPFAKRSNDLNGFLRDNTEYELSLQLRNALAPAVMTHTFPKAVVDIFVLVIESGSSQTCLSTAITSASYALMDAQIEMYDLVTAAPVAISFGKPILDLTIEEEDLLQQNILYPPSNKSSDLQPNEKENGSIILSYMPSLKQVTNVVQTGNLDVNSLEKMIDLAIEYAVETYSIIRNPES